MLPIHLWINTFVEKKKKKRKGLVEVFGFDLKNKSIINNYIPSLLDFSYRSRV